MVNLGASLILLILALAIHPGSRAWIDARDGRQAIAGITFFTGAALCFLGLLFEALDYFIQPLVT